MKLIHCITCTPMLLLPLRQYTFVMAQNAFESLLLRWSLTTGTRSRCCLETIPCILLLVKLASKKVLSYGQQFIYSRLLYTNIVSRYTLKDAWCSNVHPRNLLTFLIWLSFSNWALTRSKPRLRLFLTSDYDVEVSTQVLSMFQFA